MKLTIPAFYVATLFVLAPDGAAQNSPAKKAGTRTLVEVPSNRPAVAPLTTRTSCFDKIEDQATRNCLQASSTPTFGLLFPYPGINNTFVGPAFVGGGENNRAIGPWTTVGGGQNNTASGYGAAVGGGRNNVVSYADATIGGGFSNIASDYNAVVGGGSSNTASSVNTTIAGGFLNTASGQLATVGGGRGHNATGDYSTVGGGDGHTAQGFFSTVGGGQGNYASGNHSTVSGGYFNTASGVSTIGGGRGNVATYYDSTIAGGFFNSATSSYATVGGGTYNVAGNVDATVGGGGANLALGRHATVPGGYRNIALGTNSFAAGRRAKANHAGSFVWGDSHSLDKASSVADEFNVYASGGVRMFTNSAATTGAALAPGSGTWSMLSDRDAKENVQRVDAQAVLEGVVAMPLSTWNYTEQDDGIRHMGPMAQDFHAAFGLGVSDKLIDAVDSDGVALAAIQGLAGRG